MKTFRQVREYLEEQIRVGRVMQFAAKAHELWRKQHIKDKGDVPKIKKNSDGTEGDINVPFHKLHPDWKKENIAAGHAALAAVEKHPRDTEKAAEHVHNEWMKRNPKAEYNASQHKPYKDLPEDEKEKDRVHVRAISSTKNEGFNPVTEGERGLWDNIHAKRKRIKAGSGERMRKPGSEGAPTAKALKQSAESVEDIFDIIEDVIEDIAKENNVNSELIWEDLESITDEELLEVAAWQRKEGKNPEGGLNKAGIASYRRENPGSKLQMAVTTKPSKLKPGSKAANRRKSFCARMGGMKKRLTSAKTARDPDSRINKALRKWNC